MTRTLHTTVWSQPALSTDQAERRIEARAGSERLLVAMQRVIDRHSRITGLDYWEAAVEVQNGVVARRRAA